MQLIKRFLSMRFIFLIFLIVILTITAASQQGIKMFIAYPLTAKVSESSSDSVALKVSYMSNSSDITISKIVPVYRFSDNVVGQFMERFADSICVGSRYYNLFEVKNMMSLLLRVFKEKYLPKDTVINNYAEIGATELYERNFNDCEGVIVTNKRNIGLLKDLNEAWIKQLNLESTGEQSLLEILKYEEPVEFGDSLAHLYMKHENPVQALVKIMPDGKVEPINLTYMGAPIQLYRDKEQFFDWIEDFYQQHNLPPGCNYYYQEDPPRLSWDGANFINYPVVNPPFLKRE